MPFCKACGNNFSNPMISKSYMNTIIL
uniref:Uncharacterized protein n=1 Tax=Rhizophora mucronata TaxID=61149 RepID=A0A2P2Q606_RHIMU